MVEWSARFALRLVTAGVSYSEKSLVGLVFGTRSRGRGLRFGSSGGLPDRKATINKITRIVKTLDKVKIGGKLFC